jgi:hypothetical protein
MSGSVITNRSFICSGALALLTVLYTPKVDVQMRILIVKLDAGYDQFSTPQTFKPTASCAESTICLG